MKLRIVKKMCKKIKVKKLFVLIKLSYSTWNTHNA